MDVVTLGPLDKKELARALIKRYANDGITLFETNMERARKLSDDPLQQILIFVGLYEELFEGLTEPYPGCLLASYVYEMQQFDDDIIPIINEEFLLSRRELVALIERITENTRRVSLSRRSRWLTCSCQRSKARSFCLSR